RLFSHAMVSNHFRRPRPRHHVTAPGVTPVPASDTADGGCEAVVLPIPLAVVSTRSCTPVSGEVASHAPTPLREPCGTLEGSVSPLAQTWLFVGAVCAQRSLALSPSSQEVSWRCSRSPSLPTALPETG